MEKFWIRWFELKQIKTKGKDKLLKKRKRKQTTKLEGGEGDYPSLFRKEKQNHRKKMRRYLFRWK